MKYHFDRNPLSIFLTILFILLGLIACIPAFMLIEYLFGDNMGLGIIIFIALGFGIAYLVICIKDKVIEKNKKDDVPKATDGTQNNALSVPDSIVEELEKQISALSAIVYLTDLYPDTGITGLNAYLRGMNIEETKTNRAKLIIMLKKLDAIVKRKADMNIADYKIALVSTYSQEKEGFNQ